MAFSGNYMCTSFKQELMEGVHNLKAGATPLKWLCIRTVPL